MKLNQASLAHWYELLKDDEMKDVAHKILLYSATLNDWDAEKEKEIKNLLKIEKEALANAKEALDLNNRISKKIQGYINLFDEEGNLPLKGIFTNKVLMEFMSGNITTEEEVDILYKEVRVDYLNADKHTKMKSEYESSNKLNLDSYIESTFIEGENSKPIVTSGYIQEVKEPTNPLDFKLTFLPPPPLLSELDLSNVKVTKIDNIDDFYKIFRNEMGEHDDLEYMTEEEEEAFIKELASDMYSEPTDDEMKIARADAKKEGWLRGDLKEQICRLLVYISRYEDYVGINRNRPPEPEDK